VIIPELVNGAYGSDLAVAGPAISRASRVTERGARIVEIVEVEAIVMDRGDEVGALALLPCSHRRVFVGPTVSDDRHPVALVRRAADPRRQDASQVSVVAVERDHRDVVAGIVGTVAVGRMAVYRPGRGVIAAIDEVPTVGREEGHAVTIGRAVRGR